MYYCTSLIIMLSISVAPYKHLLKGHPFEGIPSISSPLCSFFTLTALVRDNEHQRTHPIGGPRLALHQSR